MKISSKFLLSIVVSTFSIATLMTTSAFFLERKNLQQELEITIEDTIVQQNRLLAVVDNLMKSRVHSSMDLLMQEGERYGSPQLGPITALANQRVPTLSFGDISQVENFDLVDSITATQGGTATLFVRQGDDFIRVATNVIHDGQRAIGTKLASTGAAYAAIKSGNAFYGQVDILGTPYLTGYEPMFNANKEVIGAWYVGYQADLNELEQSISQLRVLDKGFVALLDDKQKVRMHSEHIDSTEVDQIVNLQQNDWQVERHIFSPWGYEVAVAYAKSDVKQLLLQRALQIVATLTLASVLLSLLIYFMVSRVVSRPLQQVVDSMRDIAQGEGDLTVRIPSQGNDEIAQLTHYFNQFVSKIEHLVGEIKYAAVAIHRASHEIVAGNTDLSQRTTEQAASLQQTAASLEELTALVQQTASNTQEASQLTFSVSQMANSSREETESVLRAMSDIQTSSTQIAEITSLIDSIAFQTNILALNAAVESARAGEAGRGFAVVAAEVRSLAQRSAAAAGEIRELIDTTVIRISEGNELTRSAAQTIGNLVGSVNHATQLIQDIAHSATEQSAGISQANIAISQMDGVTQQNASLVVQASNAAQELEQQANTLAAAVSAFSIDPALDISVAPQKITG